MILHALELTHVGRFRESVRIGPFARGLNVLAAPNESGKTTALHAAARALFDRHTSRSEELKALQPAGTALTPGVSVEFETRAGRFRIAKAFLQRPESRLHQLRADAWELIAEADAADQRVQSLLQSALPGRGATKPEHWGFLGFLWARQGEPAAWPGLDDPEVGHRIRARLARVELDPVIEQVRAHLASVATTLITANGQPRAGGPLRAAEDDLAALDDALAGLRCTRTELDETHRRFQQSDAEVVRLEKELAERSAAANVLREQALATERLRGELDARRQALATARDRLAALVTDADTFTRLHREQTGTQSALAQARTDARSAELSLAKVRAHLDLAQSEQPRFEAHLNSLRAALQRVQSLLKLRHTTAAAEALVRQVARAEAATAEIAALEARRAAVPSLTTAKLRKLEEHADAIRTLRAQLHALGLTVELTPDVDTTLSSDDGSGSPARRVDLPARTPYRVQSPRSLALHLSGWGQVVVRSGSHDAQTAAADLAQSEATLAEGLQSAGVPSLEAAREAVTTRKELDAQIKVATTALTPHLGEHESLETLRAAAAAAVRRAEILAHSLTPSAAEQAFTLTDLESAEATHGESVPAAEKSLAEFNQKLTELRAGERIAVQAAHDATKLAAEQESRLRILEAQIKDLGGRYPEGIDAAKTSAQIAFAEAEARVVATERELPPDFEKLPDRNKRAAASLQQIANELQARRTDRDQAKAILQTLGGQGLYSRETELEEKRAEALLRRDAAREQAWCARVAHDLIEHRKQSATRAVLTPLENRLTAAFAELTADTTRRVFLDERLQISGIGRSREEVHAFDQLSQGAKEQLLLCLRLAVAQELATDEPQVLILDDVLVNTDPTRQERVLDVLGTQAERLQILILTCHPDRYRGVGQPLSLAP